MKQKLIIAIVVVAVVLVGYYLYMNGLSFTSSDAAGYGDAARIEHVNGQQAFTVGEAIKIVWPRGLSSRNQPVTVELIALTGTGGNNESVILAEHVTSRSADVYLGEWKGGVPDNALFQIIVYQEGKGGATLSSEPFTIVRPVEWDGVVIPEPSSGEAIPLEE